jgi:2-phospho-L-lactate guanylyltransferase
VIVAVVPVKNLGEAKSRLGPLLNAEERRGLVEAMLEDVLAALKSARGVSGIFVVSDGDGLVPDGWTLIPEPENRGYDQAVATALADPRVAEAEAVLVLPGDLPLVTPKDIDDFIGSRGAPSMESRIRIAPARDGDGTNALLIAPPQADGGTGGFQG